MSSATGQALLDGIPKGLYTDGQWVDSRTGKTLDVIDLATGAGVASIADAGVEDGKRALDAAVAAQAEWASTPPRVRAEILRRTFDLLQDATSGGPPKWKWGLLGFPWVVLRDFPDGLPGRSMRGRVA